MTGEAADHSIRHLRAVPDVARQVEAERSPTAPGNPMAAAFGSPDQAAMAAVLRREADLLIAVRGRSAGPPAAIRVECEPAVGSSVALGRPRSVLDSSIAPSEAGAPAVAPSTVLESQEIGRRFEALATGHSLDVNDPDPLGIGDALARLRSTDGLPEAMLPAVALRSLGEVDPAAAGQLLIGLLPSLHRVAPRLRIDLDLRDRVIAVTSDDGRTVIETRSAKRRRRDRDLVVKGRPEALAKAALGHRSRGARGRNGIAVLRALIDSPHSITDLLEDGAALPPAATWSLLSAAIAAAPAGQGFTVVHLDAQDGSEAVTVTVAAGRPLSVVRGSCGSADATVRTDPGSALRWLSGTAEAASIDGDVEAAERLRALFVLGCSHIRSRS